MTLASLTRTSAPPAPGPAADRADALLDPGTLSVLAEDAGVLAVEGLVHGVPTVVHLSDPTSRGGALGAAGGALIAAAIDRALALGRPVIGVWHSGGARIQEGVAALDGMGRVFAATVRASGRVPQVSLVLGPAAGGAAYGAALTDVVVLGPAGRIFVTGPDVVRRVTGEDVDAATLGGAEVHGRGSGVAHITAASDVDAVLRTRRLVQLLGDVGHGAERHLPDEPALEAVLPASARRAYDVHPLVRALLDEPGEELHARWARNVVTVLGRLGGRAVGVLANNPLRLGGCLDAAGSDKAARFVRLCDALGLPLVAVVDVPGYLPGVRQEWDAVVRRGAKLLHAFADARVPRVTLVTRKAYGGAYIAMNSRSLGATRVLAWPGAQVAVMGAPAAVEVIARRELAGVPEPRRSARVAELAAEHEQASGGLGRAVELGLVDEVIRPAATRRALARAIADADLAAPGHRGTHRNMPL